MAAMMPLKAKLFFTIFFKKQDLLFLFSFILIANYLSFSMESVHKARQTIKTLFFKCLSSLYKFV